MSKVKDRTSWGQFMDWPTGSLFLTFDFQLLTFDFSVPPDSSRQGVGNFFFLHSSEGHFSERNFFLANATKWDIMRQNGINRDICMIMFPGERRTRIVEILSDRRRVTVGQLSRMLGVSPSCIRKDLAKLQRANLIERAHGGAIAKGGVRNEHPLHQKEEENIPEKERVAAAAAGLIHEGDTVWLDGGSTTTLIAGKIKPMRNVTVVTNSLSVAYELAGAAGVEVIIIGGALRKISMSLIGPMAERVISEINVDKAFIGVDGITLRQGCTTTNLMDAKTKKMIMERAKQVVIVADKSKWGKVSFASFAGIRDIDSGSSYDVLSALICSGHSVLLDPDAWHSHARAF